MTDDDATFAGLRAQLADEQYARDACVILADLLMQRGDPHGDLIARSLVAERYAGAEITDPELLALHAAHDPTWLGALASPPPGVELRWYRGFVYQLQIGGYKHALEDPAAAYGAALAELANRRTTFLRQLAFGTHAKPWNYDIYLDAIDRYGAPETVDRVSLQGDFHPRHIIDTRIDDLPRLYRQIPNLTALNVGLDRFELGTLDLPALAQFSANRMSERALQALVAARCPKLQRILLGFGKTSTVTLDHVLPLLARPPALLDDLALRATSFTDDLIEPLVACPRLAALVELDLSGGTLSDRGAAMILAHAARFAHLEWLNLDDNRIDEAMCAQLAEAIPGVTTNYQFEDDD